MSQGEAKQNIFFVKQGQVKLLKELQFMSPEFASKIDLSNRQVLYEDPVEIGVNPENREAKLLEVMIVPPNRSFGCNSIEDDRPKD